MTPEMLPSEHHAHTQRNDWKRGAREPTRPWIEADMILIVAAMAAVMALLVFTLHRTSPTLTAAPQIDMSEPTTTGQGR